MTQEEWTCLGLKLLGVYLMIAYGGAFVAQTIAAFAVLMKEDGAMWRGLYTWQGPASSLLILLAAMALIWKTKKIASLLWRE